MLLRSKYTSAPSNEHSLIGFIKATTLASHALVLAMLWIILVNIVLGLGEASSISTRVVASLIIFIPISYMLLLKLKHYQEKVEILIVEEVLRTEKNRRSFSDIKKITLYPEIKTIIFEFGSNSTYFYLSSEEETINMEKILRQNNKTKDKINKIIFKDFAFLKNNNNNPNNEK